jgi:hypothetical protein
LAIACRKGANCPVRDNFRTLDALPLAADETASFGFEGPELRRIQAVVRRRAERVGDLGAGLARA